MSKSPVNKISKPSVSDSLNKLKGKSSQYQTSTIDDENQAVNAGSELSERTAVDLSTRDFDKYDNLKSEIFNQLTGIRKEITTGDSSLSDKLNDIKSKFLEKSDFRWWVGGIIGAFFVFCYLIYTFAYQPVIEGLNKNENTINKRADDIDKKFEHLKLDTSTNQIIIK